MVAAVWCATNLLLLFLQPTLHLSEELIKLFLENSTWVAGIFIVGVSGTDFAAQKSRDTRASSSSGKGTKRGNRES